MSCWLESFSYTRNVAFASMLSADVFSNAILIVLNLYCACLSFQEKLMGHLGVVLYEYLGEEYPEVLGSILGALKAIVNVIGMTKMTPPIKDLLPRLTPILKNRSAQTRLHVTYPQESNCILPPHCC
jgi:hypothetical protein